MKRLILLYLTAALLLATTPASPQSVQTEHHVPLVSVYDVDSATFTYCHTTGQGGRVLSGGRTGIGRILTVGSTTTTTAVNAALDVFGPLGVGDEIELTQTGDDLSVATLYRVITAKASADSITVNAAWDLDTPTVGYSFKWRKVVCGTAATSGWVPMSSLSTARITFAMDQGVFGSGGISARWECKDESGAAATPISVHAPAAYTTAGITSRTAVVIGPDHAWTHCRLGFALSGTDDGDDLTTNMEQVTVKFAAVQK